MSPPHTGTILLTGANSSLALPVLSYILTHPLYNTYTLLLTVRNKSTFSDPNTASLLTLLSKYPSTPSSVRVLDLSSLSEVARFADTVKGEVERGELPRLRVILCNAFTWSLTSGLQTTIDGLERTIAVCFIAHFSLIMRLLNSFILRSTSENDDNKAWGKIVWMSSSTIFPGRSPMEMFPPVLPEKLGELVHPSEREKRDVESGERERVGWGFWRYAVAKLVGGMVVGELGRRLALSPTHAHITTLSLNPGDMPDSRCMSSSELPTHLSLLFRLASPFLPILSYLKPGLRSVTAAAPAVVEVTLGEKYRGATGYFEGLERCEGLDEGRDEGKVGELWEGACVWAGLGEGDVGVELGMLGV